MVNLVKIILCLLLTLLLGCNQNQTANPNANNASIEKYLNLASNDTFTYKQRNQYNQKAFSLIDLSKNDTFVRFYLSEVTFNLSNLKEDKLYRKISKIHFEKATEAKDTLNLARYYKQQAVFNRNNQIYDSAFYNCIKAEKIYRQIDKLNELGSLLHLKESIQYNINDFLGCEYTCIKAYKIFIKENNIKRQQSILNDLGNVCIELQEFKVGIQYTEKALKLAQDNKFKTNEEEVATCFNNIGNAYKEQKKYLQALKYFKLALKDERLLKESPDMYEILISNLGYCELKLKNYNQLPYLFCKGLKISDSLKLYKRSVVNNVYLSMFYQNKNDTLRAKDYANDALIIAKKTKAPYYVAYSIQQLIKVDKKNASKNAQEYIKVNDSMQKSERQFRNKFARIAYETDEIQLQKEQAIKQKWIISGIAIFVFLIGLLLFIITKQRSRQKELLLLQSQQKANEEIYQLMLTQKTTEETARQTEKKRIALELHDGIMNKLASTRLNLFVLSKKTDTATIEKCLTHISDIYTIEQEIRSIAHDLNQDVFKEANSFIALIKDFIAQQNTTSNSKYNLELQHDINWIAISIEIKINLYRIIQEASHNINKYSKAQNVVVSIIQDGNNVCMSITDDGVGFDTSIINDGIGIKNMQQRIKSLNGKITINSIQKNSTSINLSIPIGS